MLWKSNVEITFPLRQHLWVNGFIYEYISRAAASYEDRKSYFMRRISIVSQSLALFEFAKAFGFRFCTGQPKWRRKNIVHFHPKTNGVHRDWETPSYLKFKYRSHLTERTFFSNHSHRVIAESALPAFGETLFGGPFPDPPITVALLVSYLIVS